MGTTLVVSIQTVQLQCDVREVLQSPCAGLESPPTPTVVTLT